MFSVPNCFYIHIIMNIDFIWVLKKHHPVISIYWDPGVTVSTKKHQEHQPIFHIKSLNSWAEACERHYKYCAWRNCVLYFFGERASACVCLFVRICVFIQAKSEAKIRLVFVFTLSGSIYFFIMIYGRQCDFLMPKPIKCQFLETNLLSLLLLLLLLFHFGCWCRCFWWVVVVGGSGGGVIVHFIYVFLHFMCALGIGDKHNSTRILKKWNKKSITLSQKRKLRVCVPAPSTHTSTSHSHLGQQKKHLQPIQKKFSEQFRTTKMPSKRNDGKSSVFFFFTEPPILMAI